MKKITELGRSMVEMLGVLAVIGVLSFIGLTGYNLAMKKHVQNELKYAATTRAIAVSSQMLAGKIPDKLTDLGFDANVQGYSMSLSAAPEGSALELTDEDGNLMPFYEGLPDSADEEFALAIEGEFPYDLLKFFLEWAASSGSVQKVMYNQGQLTPADLDKLYDSLADSSSSENTTKGTKKIVIYLIYKSDLALKDGEELEKDLGGHSHSEYSLCGANGEYYYIEGGETGCKCNPGYSGPRCSEKKEFCNGHGAYFHGNVKAKICLCDKGYEGVFCEDMIAYSPCQTLKKSGDKEQRGFKQIGTPCEQAGMSGQCDNLGHCIPKNAKSCSNIDACGSGEFCNYGGTYGGGSSQKGKTPNVCEKVNPEHFEYQDQVFYYNTDKDLRSWCRGADKQANCTWGFLSYQGAQSWCKSLGAELVDADFIVANCAEFEKHLPKVLSQQPYWTATTDTLVSIGGNCKTGTTFRKDGYANNAGVVCVKSKLGVVGLTADEQAFLNEMRKVQNLLKNEDLNVYTSKNTQAIVNILKELLDLSAEVITASENGQMETLCSLMNSYNSKNYEKTLKNLIENSQKISFMKNIWHTIFGIKKAFAETKEDGISKAVERALDILTYDYCKDKPEGKRYCSGSSYAKICTQGRSKVVEHCDLLKKECVDGQCVCFRSKCTGGRTLNQANCNCDCPADKPLWTGSKCTNKTCETPDDCVGWFSDADVRCLSCDNGLCRVKETPGPSRTGYGFCEVVRTQPVDSDGDDWTEAEYAWICNADGTLGKAGMACVDGEVCCNGMCVYEKDVVKTSTGIACCPAGWVWIE